MTTTSSIPTPPTAYARAASKLAFVGVSTNGSSIMSLFPVWARLLGLDARIVGYDVPVGAPPQVYRDCVAALGADETLAGALVTTHKSAVFEHARDQFGQLHESAILCREISCIARRGGRLTGSAKDPLTSGLALDHLLSGRELGDVVCLGAGGAGIAIVAALAERTPTDRRLVVVDVDDARLDLAREVHAALGAPMELICCRHEDPADNDRLLASCAPGALVINATGMGKDLPGAPITAAARFPRDSIAWDLNYRGELGFLAIAAAQQAARGVDVVDGWRYFLHGWSTTIAEVFAIELTPERFDLLAEAAEQLTATRNRSEYARA